MKMNNQAYNKTIGQKFTFRAFLGAVLGLLLACGIAPSHLSAQHLTIAGKGFKSASAEDISGTVCPTADTRWCYAVNDEKNYLQHFSIDGMTLTADTNSTDTRIRLVEKSEFKKGWELDTEAVTYADGFIYVVGSHSVKRKNGEIQLSRNLLFRLPVDPETGAPLFIPTNDEVAPEIERSDRLDTLLAEHGILGQYLRQSLQGNGLNIEGMAVIGNTVVFGLRQPSFGQDANIFSVDLACLFNDEKCNPTFVNLPIGAENLGVRDIAQYEDRLLLLMGTAIGDENGTGRIFSWAGDLAPPIEVSRFELLDGEKPEGLLILPGGTEGGNTRTIIFFDGIEDGGPRQITTDF